MSLMSLPVTLSLVHVFSYYHWCFWYLRCCMSTVFLFCGWCTLHLSTKYKSEHLQGRGQITAIIPPGVDFHEEGAPHLLICSWFLVEPVQTETHVSHHFIQMLCSFLESYRSPLIVISFPLKALAKTPLWSRHCSGLWYSNDRLIPTQCTTGNAGGTNADSLRASAILWEGWTRAGAMV